jgi:hypothetical protein
MDSLTRLFAKLVGWRSAQTMADYALILAAVDIAVFVTYRLIAQNIDSLVTNVDQRLGAPGASAQQGSGPPSVVEQGCSLATDRVGPLYQANDGKVICSPTPDRRKR